MAGLTEKVLELTREREEYRRKEVDAQAACERDNDTPARCSRRTFVTGLGVPIAAAWAPARVLAGLGIFRSAGSAFAQPTQETPAGVMYPPVDLSYFDKAISSIAVGYAAITWGGDDRQAIEDIAAVGFRGIQLRSNVVEEFNNRPDDLRSALGKRGLTMVALSSGDLSVDQPQSEQLVKHERNARFLRDAGGECLQVIDERPKDRAIAKEDYARMGELLTKLGKRIAALGISLGYHNHMGAMGETPEGVERILESSDPRYVKLELDVAHYFQGGGNPAEAIDRHSDRLLFLHIKDVKTLPAASGDMAGKQPYQFVELGRGNVDLPGVFHALKRTKFRGWAVVELDSVPDKSGTPKQSALINRTYVEKVLGYRI